MYIWKPGNFYAWRWRTKDERKTYSVTKIGGVLEGGKVGFLNSGNCAERAAIRKSDPDIQQDTGYRIQDTG